MDNKINKLLFFSIIISTILISPIYYVSNKKNNSILTIPKTFSNYEIKNNIKSKIVDTQELNFIISKYPQGKDNKYLLNTNNNEEKEKIKNILIKNGFYTDNTERDIETPIKKIINGYLGQFFRFKYFNSINWLIIPIILYLIINHKKRKKIELAFIFFYILSSLLILLKGYINFRYQLTLQPITLIFIFYYTYEIISNYKINKIKPYLASFLLFLILINGIIYNIDFIKQSIKYVKKDNTSNNQSIDQKSIDKMVVFINKLKLPQDTKIFNNNLPFLYYYTDKPAVYYLAELDIYYNQTGKHQLTYNNSTNNLGNFIKNELKCYYILSSHTHNQYNYIFKNFLETKTDLIFQSGDFLFYKIK